MVTYILFSIAGFILLFLAVVLGRTAAFKPKAEPDVRKTEESVDEKMVIAHLREMICCKTVSHPDKTQQDESEFDRFRDLLSGFYPNIFGICGYERIGDSGLLFRWKGKSEREPTVLMAHYDVVPANEDQWEKPAFEGIIEDGYLWGRGTLDTKTTLLGILESAESLIKEGFIPGNDVYFSFSGNEEVAGDGAPMIVDAFERRGIRPALVVDEGGAVVEGIFPGVTGECALVGIGEKGIMDLEFGVKSTGGHASAPPPHGPVGILAQTVVDIEKHPFPFRMTPPAAEMFDTLGRRSTFAYRLIFANLWCFRPILNVICKKNGGEMNALLRTTVAFTQMEGSPARNVLPPKAKVTANLRLISGDTAESVMRYLKGVIKNEAVTLKKLHSSDPSAFSDTQSPGWIRLKEAIRESWPRAIVSPYLMIAASDSRHFNRISNQVMRFSAMALSGEERRLIHGNDERIPLQKIVDTVAFYRRLVKKL